MSDPLKNLISWGFGPRFVAQSELLERPDLVPARIVSEGRGIYHLAGCQRTLGHLSGRLRRALSGHRRPAVGDWVAVCDREDQAVVHHIFDRQTQLLRRAAGTTGAGQVIAANVDVFFIVTSANRDLNPRRIERYLAAVWDSGATPVIVLNKVDLGGDIASMVHLLEGAAMGVPILQASALDGRGADALRACVGPGNTAALIGSSGVGKSSLTNLLLGREALATGAIREDDARGRHTTTSRHLVPLPGGGVLLDTPGMREFGLVTDEGGIETLFEDIQTLARDCRFGDCTHQGEPGCAVTSAIHNGALSSERLASYEKLRREQAFVARQADARLQREEKRRWRDLSKRMKDRGRRDPKMHRS